MGSKPNDLDRLTEVSAAVLRDAASDPEKARALVESIRWPEGIVCPECGLGEPRRMGDRRGLAQQKWRCIDTHCDRQFNWRIGTPFFAIHSGPELVLEALIEIRRGRTAISVIDHLMARHGMAKIRAQHLVLVLLEMSVSALADRAGGASFRLHELEGELRSLRMSATKAARERGRRSIGAVLAAILIAGLASGSLGKDQVEAQATHVSTEKVMWWWSGSRRQKYICVRNPGESHADWSARYSAGLKVRQEKHPPNKQH